MAIPPIVAYPRATNPVGGTVSKRIGPSLARRPLHLFWLIDASGSMSVDGKMPALNAAIRESIPHLRDAVDDHPGIELLVRVVSFAHDASWHVETPTTIDAFQWADLAHVDKGTTELGRAIHLVTEAIIELEEVGRGLPPVMILVSDGKPTDFKQPSFGGSLRALEETLWGRKASRIAIGIGEDADDETLRRFIGHDEVSPIRADRPEEIAHYIRWASTVLVGETVRGGRAPEQSPVADPEPLEVPLPEDVHPEPPAPVTPVVPPVVEPDPVPPVVSEPAPPLPPPAPVVSVPDPDPVPAPVVPLPEPVSALDKSQGQQEAADDDDAHGTGSDDRSPEDDEEAEARRLMLGGSGLQPSGDQTSDSGTDPKPSSFDLDVPLEPGRLPGKTPLPNVDLPQPASLIHPDAAAPAPTDLPAPAPPPADEDDGLTWS